MKKFVFLLVALALLLGSAVKAADVKVNYGTPTIDGKLDDIYKTSASVKLSTAKLAAKDMTECEVSAVGYYLWDEKYVYLYVTGQEGEWLHQAAKKAHSSMATDLVPEFQFRGTSSTSLGGSDHMSFEEAKVPVAYFFNGTHADYHSPRDTWDKIQYDQMREIVNLVFLTAWEIANSEAPDYKK